jgi:hypothetical protein
MRATLFFTILVLVGSVKAQTNYTLTSDIKPYKSWKVNLSQLDNVVNLSATKNNFVAPEPVMRSQAVKRKLDAQRDALRPIKTKTAYTTSKEEIEPTVEADFNGRPLGGSGIPNDNTMAISNDGIIVSAINTNVTILREDGEFLLFRTLSGIVAGQLGLLDRFYDPKVTYDPVNDRFILVFLEGSNSSDTRIVVGFTETNDPTQNWNFYALNGRPLGGETWSDYPIIAHNKEDLYITVNLLRDNESWQEGFVESFIWQINKQDGYDGVEDLTTNLFSSITFNGESVWSICPVQPALDFDVPYMYLLSVRPDAAQNDTLFLHKITNTTKSGQAEHQLRVLTADKSYGVPPSALQPVAGYKLQTNDTRVLSATIHNGDLHYVQSTLVPDKLTSGVFHGIIAKVEESNTVKAEIIEAENQDIAYPSIAYAGESGNEQHSMLITFSHSGETDYPGTSAVYHNKLGPYESLYSDVIMIKQGDSVINTFLADSIERWGDYTDVQRKYNEPGVVWLCGSYGDERALNNVWLAKLRVNNNLIAVENSVAYPNPAANSVTIAAEFQEDATVDVRLVDTRGTTVQERLSESVSAGYAEFQLNTTGVSSGMYILYITSDKGEVLHSQKILVE